MKTVVSETSLIDSASKLLAAVAGLLYVTGFAVVAGHLSRYGVSSFSVLQLQYLIAGVWACGPPVALASVVLIGDRFEERVAPNIPGRFNWRRFALATFLTSIPFAICAGLLVAIPGLVHNMTWGIGVRLYCFYLAMLAGAQIFWMSWRSPTEKETPWLNRSHAAPFYLILFLSIALGFVFWFSRRVYPLIPFSLGGGRPLTVIFVAEKNQLPPGLVLQTGASSRSIPYKLLTVTDKSYVIVAPETNESSIEIAREGILEMVVLKDADTP